MPLKKARKAQTSVARLVLEEKKAGQVLRLSLMRERTVREMQMVYLSGARPKDLVSGRGISVVMLKLEMQLMTPLMKVRMTTVKRISKS